MMELKELTEELKSKVEIFNKKFDLPPRRSYFVESEIKVLPEMELEEKVEILRQKREELNKYDFLMRKRDILSESEMNSLLKAIDNPEYIQERIQRTNVTVFASGGGTDFQSLIDGCQSGLSPHVDISGLISNNSQAHALKRASLNYIPDIYIARNQFSSAQDYNQELLRILKVLRTEIIFLAGYIKLIPEALINEYPIYNIHPSILPKHGGKGMYGLAVHESVINSGDKTTGVTIHRVNAVYDDGDIVNQYHSIPVLADDTPADLQQRVLAFEHKIIPVVMEQIAQDYQVSKAASLALHPHL